MRRNVIAYVKFYPTELFNKGLLAQKSTVVRGKLSSNNEVSLRHAFIFVGLWVIVINSTDKLQSLGTNMADVHWQKPGVISHIQRNVFENQLINLIWSMGCLSSLYQVHGYIASNLIGLLCTVK
jgi:hypothetical protein